MDTQMVMGDKAIGLLRRVHESGQLRGTQIEREVADLLGQPGDPEAARIEKETMAWRNNMNRDEPYKRGWAVMANAVVAETRRLCDIANASGANFAAVTALADLKALADTVESL